MQVAPLKTSIKSQAKITIGMGTFDAAQMKKLEKEQMNRIVDARSILILDQEFFAVGILSLELEVNWKIPTAGTNGKKIWFNPKFVQTLSIDEIIGLLCHEWMHVMFLHPFRLGDRDHRIFNIAGDAVINYILLYENKLKLPTPRIDRPDAQGKDTEQMYDIIEGELKPPEPKPGDDKQEGDEEKAEGEKEDGDSGSDESEAGDGEGNGKSGSEEGEEEEEEGDGDGDGDGEPSEEEGEKDGEGGEVKGDGKGSGESPEGEKKGEPSEEKLYPEAFDEVIPYEDDGEETPQELESRVKETVEKALLIARSRGTVPGWAEDIIKSLYEPVVPWEQIVQAWFSEKAKEDYTWKRPNRRYSDIYLPKLESPAVGHIAFLEDTSGSMYDIELSQISGQLEYLMDTFRMEMTIIYFDYIFQGMIHVDRGDKIDLHKHPGRGGTNFKVGFEKLEELNLIQDLKGIVVLTDGECHNFPEDPGIDVLWILVREYDRFNPPFGQVVTFRK
jgi:predicted metal-dependent peptidase